MFSIVTQNILKVVVYAPIMYFVTLQFAFHCLILFFFQGRRSRRERRAFRLKALEGKALSPLRYIIFQ